MKPKLVKTRVLEKLTRNSIPGILCGLVILILTGLPGSCFPKVKPVIGFDKVVHICMYIVFAFACIWGYREQYVNGDKTYRRKALLTAAIIGIAYGGLTEIIQETITYQRTGDWFDFLADSIGTLAGLLIFCLFFRKKK